MDFSEFPTLAIVKNDKNYYYLKLNKMWHLEKCDLLKQIKDKYSQSESVKEVREKFIKNKGDQYEFKFCLPLAPIGPHISINKTRINIPKEFKIKDIYVVESLDSKSETYEPALFSPETKHYVLQWYLLEVDIDEELKPEFGKPHISLACYMAIESNKID